MGFADSFFFFFKCDSFRKTNFSIARCCQLTIAYWLVLELVFISPFQHRTHIWFKLCRAVHIVTVSVHMHFNPVASGRHYFLVLFTSSETHNLSTHLPKRSQYIGDDIELNIPPLVLCFVWFVGWLGCLFLNPHCYPHHCLLSAHCI